MKNFNLILILIFIVNFSCGPSIPKYSEIASLEERETNFREFCKYYERYYPFFQIHDVNWDSLKQFYKPKALGSNSEQEFVKTLREMISPLQDPHCQIITPNDKSYFSSLYFGGNKGSLHDIIKNIGFLPIGFIILNETPFVSMIDTNSNAYHQGVKTGMKLISINNKSLSNYLEEENITYYKKNAGIHHLSNRHIKIGSPGDSITLGFLDNEDKAIKVKMFYKHDRHKTSMEFITNRYVKRIIKLETLQYGWISDTIGYIRIPSFLGNPAKRYSAKIFFLVIDGPASKNVIEFQTALKELSRAESIIIDVRDNSGGAQSIGDMVATYFTEKASFSTFSKYRDWNFPNDMEKFTKLYSDSLYPFEEWHEYKYYRNYSGQYLKPVVVIQNEGCMSACETFLSSMRHLQNVTTLGVTSGGSSTNPITVVLPNGIFLRISRRQTFWDTNRLIERNGVPPEIESALNLQDILINRDSQLEKALEVLSKKD